MTATAAFCFLLFALGPASAASVGSLSSCKSVEDILPGDIAVFGADFEIDQFVVDSLTSNATFRLSQCTVTNIENATKQLRFDGTLGVEDMVDGDRVSIASCFASFNGQRCDSCNFCPTSDGASSAITVDERDVYYDCSNVDESYTCTETREDACNAMSSGTQSCFVEKAVPKTTSTPSSVPSSKTVPSTTVPSTAVPSTTVPSTTVPSTSSPTSGAANKENSAGAVLGAAVISVVMTYMLGC